MIDVERILKEGDLVVTGRLIDASNATLLAESTFGDQSIKCIYKPIAGERPLWDFPDGNLAQREFAAYLISEYLQMHIVPLTILRDGPFGQGMVQEWIDIDVEVDLAEFFSQDDPQLRKMALFDAVINNTDRKIGHLLPHPEGKLYGCDHGVTFHHEYKLRTVLWQWAGSDLSKEELNSLESLQGILETDESAILQSLITPVEVVALQSRIQELIKMRCFPLPSTEWPAIPWPAF
jgi:uncharacterized repeat protein (TIGR03843 family)